MAELRGIGIPDRLQVFISSTIGECAVERQAARRAVSSLNFEPVLFEREGARAEPPRDFYLRKLQAAHLIVAFYRASYGWIDTAKGMTISGLEDEYREAVRLGKDLLIYVQTSVNDRDPRLADLVEEMKSGSHVIYFYQDGEDLEARVRDDITALVSDRYARFQEHRAAAAGSAEGLLASIFKGSPYRVRRAALMDRLTAAAALSRIVWVTGSAGAGKTVLVAEWAQERGAAFVNAKGLDPRGVLSETARVLGLASEAELAAPLFEDLRALLVARWRTGLTWPLVIDDPDDVRSVWGALAECLALNGAGSVIIAVRTVGEDLPGDRATVTGFSEEEAMLLQSISEGALADLGDKLPITLRGTAGLPSAKAGFEALDPVGREMLGYIALSPTPLRLEDLIDLLGGAVTGAGEAGERVHALSDLILDSPSGFSLIHDAYRDDLMGALDDSPQLRALLAGRLSRHLARTGRAWAAFTLQKPLGDQLSERLANQAIREAVFSGSNLHLVDALEHLVQTYRASDRPGPLITVLMALAEARAHQGRPADGPALLAEALVLANRLGDPDAVHAVETHQAVLALRQSASPEALQRVRQLADEARAAGLDGELGRLLLEEATALLGANETDAAIPVYREARGIFQAIGDAYGVEIATRNLVGALSMTTEGLAESEVLRAELDDQGAQSPRHRAWLCNLLAPRLRREGRIEEAEAMAREAISIGEALGDLNLVAINQVVLGNVLRADGRLQEAGEAYATAGRQAQVLGRPDLEGRSSRLHALIENEAAEASEGEARRDHAGRAEHFASHAAAIFAETFAWSEHAYALEERGDARRWLDSRGEAALDYGDAVHAYLKIEDRTEAARLLGNTLRWLGDDLMVIDMLGRAFGAVGAPDSLSSGKWLAVLDAALDQCPGEAAPQVLGALVRAFYPAAADDWWFANFLRCLLLIDGPRASRKDATLGPHLLLAVLGFARHRNFTQTQLMGLAALCLGGNDRSVLRHGLKRDLVQIHRLGPSGEALLTVRDDATRPEATFVALYIGAFLDAFGDALFEILFGDGLPEGVALDVTVYAAADTSGTLAEEIAIGLKEAPVGVARFNLPDEPLSEEHPIMVLVRKDALACLKADPERGGELEVMLARVLGEVIRRVSGSSLDDEIYASKIRDLLFSVFG